MEPVLRSPRHNSCQDSDTTEPSQPAPLPGLVTMLLGDTALLGSLVGPVACSNCQSPQDLASAD